MTTQADCSIGLKKETAYGVEATPDRFPEFIDESLAWNPTFVQGSGMRVGSRLAQLLGRHRTALIQRLQRMKCAHSLDSVGRAPNYSRVPKSGSGCRGYTESQASSSICR